MSAARMLLRGAFRVIRPRRLYEPVEVNGRRFSVKRDAEGRWAAIAAAIGQYEAKSVLDIGCAEAWFLRRAAEDFGCFGIGIEADQRRVLLGEIARLHDAVERVAVIRARLTPESIRDLPACDIVLCLSVLHHVMRDEGLVGATEFLRAVGTRARKALIFEMGTSEETQLSWTQTLPEMPEGQERFIGDLLRAAGLTGVRVIANTPSLKQEAQRLLFIAEPPSASAFR